MMRESGAAEREKVTYLCPASDEAGAKLIRLLGLARRADMTVIGTKLSEAAVAKGKCGAVLLASDASEGSIRKMEYACAAHDIPMIRCGMDKTELASAVGHHGEVGVAAISERSMSDAVTKLCIKDAQRQTAYDKEL